MTVTVTDHQGVIKLSGLHFKGAASSLCVEVIKTIDRTQIVEDNNSVQHKLLSEGCSELQ